MKLVHLCTLAAALLLAFPSTAYSLTPAESVQTATTSAQAGYHFLPDEIRKNPKDKAEYRAIQLSNGMTVLLIADPKANHALIASALPIGSMEDPNSQPGLAHYLEHMIFMGSQRYPQIGGLQNFLQKHGGGVNAFTMPDQTTYFLQVNHSGFEEAAARLADALAFPLLPPKAAAKERNAIHAEFVRAQADETQRMASVGRAAINPQHPLSRFAIGNRHTLRDKPGSKLHPVLKAFHQRHYSANLFQTVLYGKQSIEQLATLAAATFGRMPNKQLAKPTSQTELYLEPQRNTIVSYRPLSPAKLISLSFTFPDEAHQLHSKTYAYLAYLLMNRSENTLSDYLIREGLSDSGITASIVPFTGRSNSVFSISLELTEKGWAERDRIIAMIFRQLAEIRRHGIDAAYYAEIKESQKQSFEHLHTHKTTAFVNTLATNMLHFPLTHVLDGAFIAEGLDAQDAAAKLDAMTPETVIVAEISDTLRPKLRTPHFNAPYDVRKITAAERARWLDWQNLPAISLPTKNPYFATDFSSNNPNVKRDKPKLLAEGPGLQVYNMPSALFPNDPHAHFFAVFNIYPPASDLKSTISAGILNYMLHLNQSQTTFQAAVAGMGVDITSSRNRLMIESSGYAQHLPRLTEDYVREFIHMPLTQALLDQGRQRYFEALDAKKQAGSLAQAVDIFDQFETYPAYETEAKREAAAAITLADIENLRRRLLNEATSMRVISVGNFSDGQVKALADTLQKHIKHSNHSLHRSRYPEVGNVARQISHTVYVPHEDNALSVLYLPNGYTHRESTIRANLLRRIISQWYFDDLRTDKQLGYHVGIDTHTIGQRSGLRFSVQSANTLPAEIMRHNQRFFQETLTKLENLSDADFEQHRSAMLERLERKHESLHQEADGYMRDFTGHHRQFNSRQKGIATLKKLSKTDIIAYYRQAVIDDGQKFVFAAQALGRKASGKAAPLPGFEQIASISQLQSEFEIKEFDIHPD